MVKTDNGQADNGQADITMMLPKDKQAQQSQPVSEDLKFKEPSFDDSIFAEDKILGHDVYHDKANGINPYAATRSPLMIRQNHLTAEQEKALVNYNHITYLLYALSFFTAGLTWIIPIVMNYLRRREADNTWLATHFDWQIKTFWYSIVAGVVGMSILGFSIVVLGVGVLSDSTNVALSSILLAGAGGLILLWSIFWHLYRIVRGWIALTNKTAI